MSVSRAARLAVVVASLAAASLARAQTPGDMGAPPDGAAAPMDPYATRAPVAAVKGAHAGSPIADALDDFDFGDYEAVVARLRPLAENGARELPNNADRLEALRVYGIACTLTNRPAAAEGAFLLLLRENPSLQLDPRLVRPEAVAFFKDVRERHHYELVQAYRNGRPKNYLVFDILPLVGQIQNRQWKKLAGFGGAELALFGTTVVTWVLLDQWAGKDGTFAGHTGSFNALHDINATSFALLLGVTTAGIIDGFVFGVRRKNAERRQEAQLGY